MIWRATVAMAIPSQGIGDIQLVERLYLVSQILLSLQLRWEQLAAGLRGDGELHGEAPAHTLLPLFLVGILTLDGSHY